MLLTKITNEPRAKSFNANDLLNQAKSMTQGKTMSKRELYRE